ncbi:hypothetical protein CYLTODRAFT_492963 [Cylindrobasidium torrendii FP15055 ss-10]|uniref:Uncharacterized protein n=1 Tax=Cylindrobasidium torrendii FP15055 ss-10 TaxID=1314674 RepID=A0A0D7B1Y8_9AGAR|nr:hypothetical protein CYLTODRAFT_492963 [Cylindrobasidium torrendii FP15055 ss-10]
MAENYPQSRKLFSAPHKSGYYFSEDYKILCKSTPISKGALPSYLKTCNPRDISMPPKLWLGWNMGSEADFFKYLDAHSPNSICYDDDDGQRCPASFCNFSRSLRKRCGISGANEALLEVAAVRNEHGEPTLALTVGCNQFGCLPDDCITKVTEYVQKGEASWWLDIRSWHWQPGPDTDLGRRVQEGEFAVIVPQAH